MRYRLGLDIGANSIGWCALTLDDSSTPNSIAGIGARVYPDGRNPKDSSSLAAARRGPRSMRRNRDRYLQRRHKLLNALTRFGVMPGDDETRTIIARLDPYALREKALHERLELWELGRVLFHLNQHRGFKSNRKTDRGDNESGLIKDAGARTRDELQREGCATIGQWLARRHAGKEPVRVRLAGSGKTKNYAFYPTREMIEDEFETVWAAQAGWNPALTAAMRLALHSIIFHQRNLKPVPVGRCWLEPTEERAPRALPTAQRFRIAQTLSNLRLALPGQPEQPLTMQQREVLANVLYRGRDRTFDQIRGKNLLNLPSETDFNLRDDGLVGCAIASKAGSAKMAGEAWHRLDLATQDTAIRIVLDAETDETATEALIALGLGRDAAERLAKLGLPDGHAAFSAVAMGKILPHLEAGYRYDEAVKRAGYAHHSDRRTGEIRTSLPYYGELLFERIGTGSGEANEKNEEKRYGKAPNPTVHVALNEIRRVVNAIVERFGEPPTEIVVETLRDLGRSKKQREAEEKRNKENRVKNDARKDCLANMGLPLNATNMMRLRLLEEQGTDPKNRVCPYTGAIITPRTALSADFEEDHILPFATALDDSSANRVLVSREANRIKGKRTPYEAFGHTPQWPEILQRAQLLPENKRWRFQPDALEKFARDGDFLARHLADSATIARWAKEYLEVLAPGKVWTTPGRLTSMLRQALGLNSRSVLGKGGHGKDRTDHRHHAIDAVAIALTDRSTLQKVSRAAKAAEGGQQRLMERLDEPWEGFVADVAKRIQAVVVSHKPDTGWQAALHNDTAYGIIEEARPTEPNVVVRKSIDALIDWSPADAIASVRDPALAAKIAETLAIPDKAARKAALTSITHPRGVEVKRVRTMDRLDNTQGILDARSGKPFKLFKLDGNHRTEIWQLPNGKWVPRVVSTFDAAQEAEAARLKRPCPDGRPHPAARLMMRLHKNDLVAFGDPADRRILRVVKMSGGSLFFAAHNESGNLKLRDETKADPFKYLQARASRLQTERARKVHITPDGRVRDPGPLK